MEQIKNTNTDPSAPGVSESKRSEISPGRRPRTVPSQNKHVEVNCCKTPGCENFGLPFHKPSHDSDIARKVVYRITSHGHGYSALLCLSCGVASRIKSNLAVYEEYDRQRAGLIVTTPLACPDEACPNHAPKPAEARSLFRKYGKTKSGSDRWQCRTCKRTFALGKPTKGHKKPHLNGEAFQLIVNKVSISRMAEILDVSFATVYGKIDFIHQQCSQFAASRENRLPGMAIPRLYLSTDRQDYMVNWGDRKARRTIQLTTVATTDQESGYVFGLIPNFDAAVDPDEVEADWAVCGDATAPPAHRKYARIWTRADYERSLARAAARARDDDEDVATRDDLDAPELLLPTQQLPVSGAQVHADYLMQGHYWVLRSLLGGVEKLRFFLDRDAGLVHACMGAFAQRIRDRSADVVQVDITKDMTVDNRKREYGRAKAWFDVERKRFPDLDDAAARSAILAERVGELRKNSPSEARRLQGVWIDHPFPDIAEPRKRWRFLTDVDDYDDRHVANLLLRASLWPVDTVFNRIRRRLAAFERPVSSVRRARRLWQIYAPYDAGMLEKYLTIFRVWHNYVWVNPKTGKTAAEVIGLAAGKIRVQDIIYFDLREFV